jgi:exopolyphosphatase/guanosine-5'-triphosphate,3'-diphosphate pyrophosphatase
MQRMKLWAKVLDPDFAHSQRVARLALELYDGLVAAGLIGSGLSGSGSAESLKGNGAGSDARDSLNIAALLHDVGKAKGDKGHHKKSLELIKGHGTPLGWSAETMTRAAVVARFHAGALPTRSHKALRDLLADEQRVTIQLAAVLRLANGFDSEHDGHIRKVRLENVETGKRRTNGFLRKPARLGPNEALVISAEGFVAGSSTAQTVAAERYLLEMMLRRPVVVRPMKNAVPRSLAIEAKRTAS